jgi:hypothetical protein
MTSRNPIPPDQLDRDGSPNLDPFEYQFLAEGDSWFTLGTLNPLKNANLLQELSFNKEHITVNCANPGDTLSKIVDWRRDPRFVGLLSGRTARHWRGILLSAGGNDLIAAIKTPPGSPGAEVPLEHRLLRTVHEWGSPGQGPSRFVSDAGWQTFCAYLRANFEELIKLRDKGINAGAPIFLHSYAVPTPRDAGVSLGPFKSGPWLLPGLVMYGIPPGDDRLALAEHLIIRLRDLLQSIADALPNVHLFDSTQVPLNRADANSTGDSGDWINEIHLNKSGCRKVAQAWSSRIEAVLG